MHRDMYGYTEEHIHDRLTRSRGAVRRKFLRSRLRGNDDFKRADVICANRGKQSQEVLCGNSHYSRNPETLSSLISRTPVNRTRIPKNIDIENIVCIPREY